MTSITSEAINASSRPVASVVIPDSKLAHEITELVRDSESPLPFNHSSRVFYWGALTGVRRGLSFDVELLYAGAVFHDMGLTRASRWTARIPRATSCVIRNIKEADNEEATTNLIDQRGTFTGAVCWQM